MARTLRTVNGNRLTKIRAKCIRCGGLIALDGLGRDIIMRKTDFNKTEIEEVCKMLGNTICKHCHASLTQTHPEAQQAAL